MIKGIIPKLIISLISVLILMPVGSFLITKEFYGIGIFLLIVGMFIAARIVMLFFYNTNKIVFMFNAIENDDFTFRFSQYVRSNSDKIFNETLNRITDMIRKTKLSVIEKEKYYERIFDYSTNGIIVFNPETGSVFQINHAAKDLLGTPILYHINHLSSVSKDLPTILLNSKIGKNDTINFYNETRKISLSLSYATINMNDKSLKIVSITDVVSEMDNIETESWIRLSRVITHEIMNSLAPISSLSEELRKISDRDTINRGLEIIGDTSQHLKLFVENYRKFTRVPNPIIKEFSLSESINKLVALVYKEAQIVSPKIDIRIEADENLISQVLTNLLKNAAEASAINNGRVWVTLYYNDKNRVTVEVCNTGEKIREEVVENIFVPFFTTKTDGSGIGLSLSRQIMRLHNGTLTYTSRRKDNEDITVFSICF